MYEAESGEGFSQNGDDKEILRATSFVKMVKGEMMIIIKLQSFSEKQHQTCSVNEDF